MQRVVTVLGNGSHVGKQRVEVGKVAENKLPCSQVMPQVGRQDVGAVHTAHQLHNVVVVRVTQRVLACNNVLALLAHHLEGVPRCLAEGGGESLLQRMKPRGVRANAPVHFLKRRLETRSGNAGTTVQDVPQDAVVVDTLECQWSCKAHIVK